MGRSERVELKALRCAAFRVPTDRPEADGTFSWDSTTLVVAEVEAAGRVGLGYSYSDACIVGLICGELAKALEGRDLFDVPGCCASMRGRVRNLGRSGLAAEAISAVDAALWDLKAKILALPLAGLLGRRREAIDVYGSGGFTSYDDAQLRDQLQGWVQQNGCRAVKMKIGSRPDEDPRRIEIAKRAIGEAQLYVDANGAFDAKAALRMAHACAAKGVSWFEEPVTSDDPAGLRLVRESGPPGVEIAAGEYNFTLDDALRLLQGNAVDVLQADVTRCCGVTGFLEIAALCEAFHIDLSAHCAPAQHRHVACSAKRLRNLEYFHDHVRIEHMMFDGAPQAREGRIAPDLGRDGAGLEFKRKDAERFRIAEGTASL